MKNSKKINKIIPFWREEIKQVPIMVIYETLFGMVRRTEMTSTVDKCENVKIKKCLRRNKLKKS